MKPPDQIDHLLARLAEVPLHIAQATASLSEAEKHRAASNRGWSAAEILAHVRASDDIQAHRLYEILARDNPTLLAYDERHWAEIAGYSQADFESSLKTYALRRNELVRMLRQVAHADWERVGIHEIKGSLSLWDVATSLAEHEEEHCRQLEVADC